MVCVVMNGLRVYVGDNVGWPAGTYTQKCTVYGSNDPTFASSTMLVDDVELCDGGHVATGGAVEEGDITDGTTSTWRRTYDWTNSTAYRYYRFLYKSGAGIFHWYSIEMTYRVA